MRISWAVVWITAALAMVLVFIGVAMLSALLAFGAIYLSNRLVAARA